jgi:RHS repeat-associated protein
VSEYYDGVIDSVAVWNKTLTSSEVATLYNTSDKSGYHLTTKEYDTDISLYYFWSRWYDPEIGRFTTVDPLFKRTEALSEWLQRAGLTKEFVNRYGFCLNDPVNKSDETGLLIGNLLNFIKCFFKSPPGLNTHLSCYDYLYDTAKKCRASWPCDTPMAIKCFFNSPDVDYCLTVCGMAGMPWLPEPPRM